jgi:hypothetical protein
MSLNQIDLFRRLFQSGLGFGLRPEQLDVHMRYGRSKKEKGRDDHKQCREMPFCYGRKIHDVHSPRARSGPSLLNVRYNGAWDNDPRDSRQARAFTMLIFKERPADMYTSANMINTEAITTILTHR